jgi:hypothetical protein
LLEGLNALDAAVEANLPGFHPIEGFEFCRETGVGCGEERSLLVEVPVAVPNDVTQEAARLIVQVVPYSERLKTFPEGETIQQFSLDHAADGADLAPDSPLDFRDGVAEDVLYGVCGPGKRTLLSEPADGLDGSFREVSDPEMDMKAPGVIPELVEDIPQGQGVLASRDGYQERCRLRNGELLHGADDSGFEIGEETGRAKIGVV